jgi:Uncharacterized protein conserved in bacteria (DUF2325)
LSALRILVVGGFTRLDPFYRDAPADVDVDVDAIYDDCPSLEARAAAADAIVLVATNVSHPAAAKVRIAARRHGTPLETARGPSVARVRASITAAFRAAKERRRGATPPWRQVEGSANGPC